MVQLKAADDSRNPAARVLEIVFPFFCSLTMLPSWSHTTTLNLMMQKNANKHKTTRAFLLTDVTADVLSRNIYMLNEDEDVCWQTAVNVLITLMNDLIRKNSFNTELSGWLSQDVKLLLCDVSLKVFIPVPKI